MQRTQEPQQLGKVINQSNLLSDDRCENCHVGFKHAYRQGDEWRQRLWCKRCIDIYYRKVNMSFKDKEKAIQGIVEPKYAKAKLGDLSTNIRDKLLNLEYGQDVFVYGDVGVGKTYAMAALIRHYVYEGYECRRLNFDDFCVAVRATFAPDSKRTESDLVEPLKWIDKLFIDDLGLRSKEESDFVYSTFYQILNKRQERLLPTFITSNKSIEQLGQTFDARIASRLQTALIIELIGEDKRTLQGKAER